jgi:hypothetical protein
MIMQQENHTENKNQESIADERRRADQKKKKIIKGMLIFSVVVIVLYAIVSLLDPETLFLRRETQDKDMPQDISFYPIDDPFNTPDNEEYLEYDSRMFYHNPFEGTTYSVEPETLEQENEDIVFFYQYFEAIRTGNTQAYADLFSSAYREEIASNFTPQLLYDITVYPQTESGEIVSYRLEYRIFRNNGTFRDDVGSDTVRSQQIVLTKEGGLLKIARVSTNTSYLKP